MGGDFQEVRKQCLRSSIGTDVNPGIVNPAKLPFIKIGEKADTSYVKKKKSKGLSEDILTKIFNNKNQPTKRV